MLPKTVQISEVNIKYRLQKMKFNKTIAFYRPASVKYMLI